MASASASPAKATTGFSRTTSFKSWADSTEENEDEELVIKLDDDFHDLPPPVSPSPSSLKAPSADRQAASAPPSPAHNERYHVPPQHQFQQNVPSGPPFTAYVTNIDPFVGKADVLDEFGKCGAILELRPIFFTETERVKGIFIDFGTLEGLNSALSMEFRRGPMGRARVEVATEHARVEVAADDRRGSKAYVQKDSQRGYSDRPYAGKGHYEDRRQAARPDARRHYEHQHDDRQAEGRPLYHERRGRGRDTSGPGHAPYVDRHGRGEHYHETDSRNADQRGRAPYERDVTKLPVRENGGGSRDDTAHTHVMDDSRSIKSDSRSVKSEDDSSQKAEAASQGVADLSLRSPSSNSTAKRKPDPFGGARPRDEMAYQKKREEEAAKKKAEDEARAAAEDRKQKEEVELAQLAAEQELKAEEARRKKDEDVRRKEDEDVRRKKDEEIQRKKVEEIQRQKDEEIQRKKDEEIQRKKDEEIQRKKHEHERQSFPAQQQHRDGVTHRSSQRPSSGSIPVGSARHEGGREDRPLYRPPAADKRAGPSSGSNGPSRNAAEDRKDYHYPRREENKPSHTPVSSAPIAPVAPQQKRDAPRKDVPKNPVEKKREPVDKERNPFSALAIEGDDVEA